MKLTICENYSRFRDVEVQETNEKALILNSGKWAVIYIDPKTNIKYVYCNYSVYRLDQIPCRIIKNF